jgi:hypothetical protein
MAELERNTGKKPESCEWFTVLHSRTGVAVLQQQLYDGILFQEQIGAVAFTLLEQYNRAFLLH